MTARETLFHVTGMSCQSCVRHVSGTVRALPGVQDVEVQLKEGKVRVLRDPSTATEAQIVSALAEAGYAARVAG